MYTTQKLCSICLENNSEVIIVSETDSNNVKWSCKLRFCVPEVKWTEDCCVCRACTSQLDTFCSFRNRCLESNGFYKWAPRHLEPSNDNTETDLSTKECPCSLCISANTYKDIEQHKVNYTCYLCNETFTSKLVLTKHVTSHSSHYCNLCEQNFTTSTQLELHVTQTHNDQNLCQFCNKSFKSVTYLKQHVTKVHQHSNCESESNKVQSNTPNVACDIKVEKLDESKVEHSGISFVSEHNVTVDEELKVEGHRECSENSNDTYPFINEPSESNDNIKLVSSKKKLKKETNTLKKCRKQSRKTAFICEECKSVFISSKKLINHAIRSHGFDPSAIKPFECDKCDSKFSTSSNLLQHKKYHMGKRTHICTFCGKGYITKSDLNTHEKQHLNKREYQCVGCPKTFNTNKDLRSHRLVVHTDPSLWNYVCTFCQKRFPIKSNLDQHMRRHTGEKRFGCHICEKRFVDKIVLQKHIKSHSNFRAFKCEHCTKEYKDNRVLEVHMTKIHGIGNAKIPIRVKKYFCHVCPKSYFAKNKLTRHMFSHTGEKPYVCHICDRKFTDKSYVKQHLKTTHNVFQLDVNK